MADRERGERDGGGRRGSGDPGDTAACRAGGASLLGATQLRLELRLRIGVGRSESPCDAAQLVLARADRGIGWDRTGPEQSERILGAIQRASRLEHRGVDLEVAFRWHGQRCKLTLELGGARAGERLRPRSRPPGVERPGNGIRASVTVGEPGGLGGVTLGEGDGTLGAMGEIGGGAMGECRLDAGDPPRLRLGPLFGSIRVEAGIDEGREALPRIRNRHARQIRPLLGRTERAARALAIDPDAVAAEGLQALAGFRGGRIGPARGGSPLHVLLE